ncbi:glutaminase [Microbacterium natoriense]|uniref:Glutaminase n=1 Tax=Microbacterium natoriense TaxID=284570 RepID=A0AAW8ETI2_9MICO|nr:glutaminase A [Microbacterium natoriense]MDQ0645929.1 glutaminase [Microbacterium natoriense]
MFESDVADVPQLSSTGLLPGGDEIAELVGLAHARYAEDGAGAVADYIPILAEADPSWFGLSLVGVDGRSASAGDIDVAFSIQSISKAFVFALVCEELGHEAIHDVVGVNNTGLAFNSVVAVELNGGSPMNSMVNAGAIATTALVPAADADERWQRIRDGLSRFAGRPLALDGEVYRSESFSNHRNQALARLLQSYDRLAIDPVEAVDIYTRQCSLAVTAADLAVMGATLAAGGTNPLTGDRVISVETSRDTLALLASCGMYERSGEWLFEIGLPAKSGVSGGIVAIAPGKGAVGTFSPPLDPAGNSVRGQRACAYLSRALGLNLFASAPPASSPDASPTIGVP